MIPFDHTGDVVAPKLDVFDGKLSCASVRGRPRCQIGKSPDEMQVVGACILDKMILQSKIPISLLWLDGLPFEKAPQPADPGLLQKRIEYRKSGEPFGSRGDPPRTGIISQLTGSSLRR